MEFDTNIKYQVDINDFKVIEQLSFGAFGTVFSVQNKKTKEYLAAKVMKINGKQDILFINREIRTMIHFNHPTIIKFRGYSLKDFWGQKNVTIFMELAKNRSLKDVLKKCSNGLSPEQYDNTAKQIILIGIARGMMELHKGHLIHRDLKPENVLLDENFHPIITDFGLSKFYEAGHSMNQSGSRGTAIYMAPEAFSDNYNIKADVYAFGILMYEVVTDQTPYPDILNNKIKIHQIPKLIKENMRPKFDFPIKKSIKKLIESCWAQNPNDRPTFEQIFNKLAYNFDDFVDNDDIDDDDDYDENLDEKYFLENVDNDLIYDYLDEIANDESKKFTDNDFVKRIEAIENKIKWLQNDNELLKLENKNLKEENEKMNGKILLIENKCNKNVEELNSIKTIKNNENVIINDIKLIKSEINKLNKKEQFVIPDEIYESIQNAQDSANKANSKYDELRSENDKIHGDLKCLKYEAKKLKESLTQISMNSGESIPDEIYESIQNAQDSANKANSKCDKLRSENDKIHGDLKCLKYEAKKLKESLTQISMNSGESIPDEIYESIQNAQDSANKANSKYDELRSENDKIHGDLKCLKYEAKKLKESLTQISMNSGESIPDEIYESIQNAQDSANKANSKCDKLRSENDKIHGDLKCLKYEAKKLKESLTQISMNSGESIPDEIYESIQNAQDSANKANSKCDKLRSENDKIHGDLKCLKYEAKKLKESLTQISMNSGESIPDEIYESIQNAQDSANKANSKCDKLRSENDKIHGDLKCLKYEAKKLKESLTQISMNSGESIPDEIYESIQNAQDSANKANSKYDELRSENDKIHGDLKCLKYEAKKLKESLTQISMNSGESIPDEIYESIQNAQDSANKANSKCDKLRSENDKIHGDLKCLKYEAKKLKESLTQISMNSGESIPDEIYESIQNAQDSANKANSKCDKLRSENDKIHGDLKCLKYEAKKLKESLTQISMNSGESIPDEIYESIQNAQDSANKANSKCDKLRSENDKIHGDLKCLKYEAKKLKESLTQISMNSGESIPDEIYESIQNAQDSANKANSKCDKLRSENDKIHGDLKCLKYEAKKLKESLTQISMNSGESIPDEIYESIQNAQDSANKANSKYDELRSENDKIHGDLKCLKYEAKKLKESLTQISMNSGESIPDEIYESIQNAQDSANKANSKYDELRSENDKIHGDLKCLKYEVKKIKVSETLFKSPS